MRVRLPRTCTGEEIIAAFKAAGTFEETPERKWEVRERDTESEYIPGSVKLVATKKEIVLHPVDLREKGWFRKRKVLAHDYNTQISLSVKLEDRLDDVDVSVAYLYDDYMWEDYIVRHPLDPNFSGIRPAFEKILERFYAQLAPQPV